MASGDNFWEESDVKALDFDDAESSAPQMCGVSLGGTARLSQQIKAGLGSYQKDFFNTVDANEETTLQLDLSQLVPEKVLNIILEADEVDFSYLKEPIESKEEELRILRRQVQSRWSPPDIDFTLRRILTGQPYSLELYRSLNSKKELLKAAVALGDGDAILMVVLFLSQTLKKNVFEHTLSTSPTAIQHYVSYLTTKMQIQEVTDLLVMLGKSKEASMKHFGLACSNSQRQLQRLRVCLRSHFNEFKEKLIIENFIKLIEWEGNAEKPIGEPVLNCLKYSCEQHWDSKGPLAPTSLVQEQGVSEKLFQWITLNARAAAGSWTDIDSLFITKGWLGAKRAKTELPMDEVVVQLYKLSAPMNVLLTYLELIDNLDKRLEVAKRLHCYRIVIDVYILLKDRQGILTYKADLHPQSEDYFYAEQKLRTTNTKWKN